MQLLSLVFGESKRERIIVFAKKRFWLVSFIGVLMTVAVFFAFFSDEVTAKIFYANGFYTKVCGDNVSPHGDLDGNVFRPDDACGEKCDLNAGTCSGDEVFRFECDGKTTDCRSNAKGPSSSQSLNRPGLCGKTVQIDVFKTNCLEDNDDEDDEDDNEEEGGNNAKLVICHKTSSSNNPWVKIKVSASAWPAHNTHGDFIVNEDHPCPSVKEEGCNSLPSYDPRADLQDFIVWYAGDCQPGVPVCNTDSVSLSATSSPVNPNSSINFKISGDASTFVDDDFDGGAVNCTGDWAVNGPGKTCTAAAKPGTYTWVHSWKHCEGSFSNCSNTCTKSVKFKVASPTPSPTPTPAPKVDIEANGSDGPITIPFDSSAKLSWTSSRANTCVASGSWSGDRDTSGSKSTGDLTSSKTYTITCKGPGGLDSDSVTVNVEAAPDPKVDIEANGSDGPITIANDTSAILSWSSSNANNCVALNAWTGTKNTSGMESTGMLTSSKTYTITCKGPGGLDSDSVTVNVEAAPPAPTATVDIKANGSDGPITIDNNTAAVLSWSSSHVTGCVASNAWLGSKAFSGIESTGNLTSAKTYTITCAGPGGTDSDSVTVNVEAAPPAPTATVDIKANGSDGPITIPRDTSANLSWTSSRATACVASGGWSGNKDTSGNASTSDLTSSKTFTITCTGAGGSASDSVIVNVEAVVQPLEGNLVVQKTGSNLSDGTSLSEQTAADPGEVILFSIQVGASVAQLDNIIVKDVLPSRMKFKGNLKVDNALTSGDIISGIGLNIGSLSAGQIKTITFEAQILASDKFDFGDTKLFNSAVASATGTSAVDTAQVTVTKKAVAGAVTDISTGLTNNPILDSFILPLLVSLAGIWIFKSKLVRFEEWKDSRLKDYNQYRSDKVLAIKIARIKSKEFLQRRIA